MKIRRIPFSPDEWLAGTAELSPYDRGIYITVCALIYSRGERIGIELLARHCGVHGNALNASLARLDAARKIVRNGSEIGQKRCENELENARKPSGNGLEIEGEVNKNNEVTKTPRARVSEYISTPSVPKKDSDADASGADAPIADPVKDLWDRGLAILGRKHRSLLGKLVKQCGQIAVLGAIADTEREQPVDPVAYFIQCCEGRRRNGGSDPYELLARAAIEYDERQSGGGDVEATH